MTEFKGTVCVDRQTLSELKRSAEQAENKRYRLCLHNSLEDQIQEMLIVLSQGTYFQPHKHPPHKTESYHVVEGKMRVVHFHDDGSVRRVIDMEPTGGNGVFLYRLAEPVYHTVIPLTPFVVYHETFLGPFCKEKDILYCEWAPPENDPVSGRKYIENIMKLSEARSAR